MALPFVPFLMSPDNFRKLVDVAGDLKDFTLELVSFLTGECGQGLIHFKAGLAQRMTALLRFSPATNVVLAVSATRRPDAIDSSAPSGLELKQPTAEEQQEDDDEEEAPCAVPEDPAERV